jgi:membrane associated rhomboid family serine protease
MQIFWTIQDIPELAGLNEDQQRTAFRTCYQKYLFSLWQTWAGCALMSTIVSICMAAFGPLLGAPIGGAIGGVLLGVIITNALRPKLRAYVAHHFRIDRVQQS